MPISLTIPTLGKPKNVKDAIIFILTNEWPLSARKIYNRVKNNGLSVSYQAVHKTINQLVEKEVIIRSNGDYQISIEWAKRVKDFGERLIYKNKNLPDSVTDSLRQSYASFTLETLYDYYKFMMDLLEHLINQTEAKDVGAIYFKHMYWALSASDKEYNQFKMLLSKRKAYIICNGNTYADKMLAKFYSFFNTSIKLGVSYVDACDFFTGGDYTVQAHFPDNIRKITDDAYKNIKDVAILKKFYDDTFHKKTEINVVLMKNQKLSEQLRNRVLSYFKK